MKYRRGVLVFAIGLLGGGVAQAAIGRFARAAVWTAAMIVLAMLAVVWAPFAWLLIAAWLGTALDAAILSVRRDLRIVPSVAILAVFFASVAGFVVVRELVVEAFKAPSSSMLPTIEIGDHYFVDKLARLWRSPAHGDLIVFRYPCDPARDYDKRVIALAGESVEVRCNVVYVNGKAIPNTLVDANASADDYLEDEGRWVKKSASRYHEHLGDHDYDVFHDPDRPLRDQRIAAGTQQTGDFRDFPEIRNPTGPSCANTMDAGRNVQQVAGAIVKTKDPDKAGVCEPQLHYVVPPDHVFVLGDYRNNSNDSRVWGSVPVSSIKGYMTGIWYSKGPSGIRWSRLGHHLE